MTKPIKRFTGKYRFLSNFHPSPIRVRDLGVRPQTAQTVEHFFQCSKTRDPFEQQAILSAPDPATAKRAGRLVKLRDDWEDIKLLVMTVGVREKFYQNKDLRQLLLATDNAELIEGNTWGDTYWGVCNERGENRLGLILMEVRDEMRRLNDGTTR